MKLYIIFVILFLWDPYIMGIIKNKWERTNIVKDKEYLQGNINKGLVTAFSSTKIKVL